MTNVSNQRDISYFFENYKVFSKHSYVIENYLYIYTIQKEKTKKTNNKKVKITAKIEQKPLFFVKTYTQTVISKTGKKSENFVTLIVSV